MRLTADLRFAARQFRNSTAVTFTALTVIALGVGATTAIFGIFDQVLLRSLPVSHPNELVRMQGHSGYFNGNLQMQGGSQDEYFSYPAYRYLRDSTDRIFSGVLASSPGNQVGVQGQGRTTLASVELVSGNYFQVLGVEAAAGRTLQPADDAVKMGSTVAMLSYSYWQSRFGSDPHVLGAAIRVNGHPFTIVGIAPARFHTVSAGETPDLFVPMTAKPAVTPDLDNLTDHNALWLNIVARLAQRVTMKQAATAIASIWHAERLADYTYLDRQNPDIYQAFVNRSHMKLLNGATGFSPLRDALGTPIEALLGMSGLLLLMACANVAGLLLVRAAGRAREISVRYALGARRGRIVQQLLAEGFLLGIAGGAFGLLLAHPISELLVRRLAGVNEGEMPFASTQNARILLIALAVTLLTSVLFSLAPAFRFWRPEMVAALRQQNVTASGGALLIRRLAVGTQIAVSVALLVVAGLFVRTVAHLRAEDLGFRPDHLIEFAVDPRLAGYRTDQVNVIDARILGTLQALPGVLSASATDDAEMEDSANFATLSIPGYRPVRSDDRNVEWSGITPGYLKTLGVPLVAGREFTEADRQGAPPVAIIGRQAAIFFYGSVQKSLGSTLKGDDRQRTIVGVAGDFHHGDARSPVDRRVFVPYLQQKPHNICFVLRTAAPPGAMLETVRRAMHTLDSSLALDVLETMDTQVENSMGPAKTLALLASSFGILAALMSAVGLYGALTFATAQRTREFGVRMALGASRRSVARLLLLETGRLAGISILLGLPMAWGFGRLARSLLFGVPSADPLTFAAAILLVAATSVVASALPTWRATTIEPMHALRCE